MGKYLPPLQNILFYEEARAANMISVKEATQGILGILGISPQMINTVGGMNRDVSTMSFEATDFHLLKIEHLHTLRPEQDLCHFQMFWNEISWIFIFRFKFHWSLIPGVYRGYPTKRALSWQIGPFWQDTLDICITWPQWVKTVGEVKTLCFSGDCGGKYFLSFNVRYFE